MILYEIICNTIITSKYSYFPPAYSVHLYTAVKGLSYHLPFAICFVLSILEWLFNTVFFCILRRNINFISVINRLFTADNIFTKNVFN